MIIDDESRTIKHLVFFVLLLTKILKLNLTKSFISSIHRSSLVSHYSNIFICVFLGFFLCFAFSPSNPTNSNFEFSSVCQSVIQSKFYCFFGCSNKFFLLDFIKFFALLYDKYRIFFSNHRRTAPHFSQWDGPSIHRQQRGDNFSSGKQNFSFVMMNERNTFF